MGQPGESLDIDVEHGFDAGPFAVLEKAVIAQAGVIDQQSHAFATGRERGEQGFDLHFIRQIGGVAVNGQAGPVEFFAQDFQPFQTPGHEDERTGVRRQLPGKLRSEPRGGAGDERRATMEKIHAERKMSNYNVWGSKFAPSGKPGQEPPTNRSIP